MHPNPEGQVAVVSITPSQSLSLPSQISALGKTHPSHTTPSAPLQTMCPALHSPTPTLFGSRPAHTQEVPTPGKLQSLSMPSQTSGIGVEVALQTSLPAWQTNVPELHVPRPLPHFSPTPGSMPSSGVP